MNQVHELHNHDGHINTFSGGKVNLLAPTQDQISIFDIGKGLAHQGHFGGQTPRYFSVAQHSLLVEELIPDRDNHQLLLAALLHDASEAYLGDVKKPLKILLPFYQELEKQFTDVIFRKYQLPLSLLKEVKPYDKQAQELEFEVFYRGKKDVFRYWSPEESCEKFFAKLMDNPFYEAHNLIIDYSFT